MDDRSEISPPILFGVEFIVKRMDVNWWEAKKQDGEVTHYGAAETPYEAIERCYHTNMTWNLEHPPLAQVAEEE